MHVSIEKWPFAQGLGLFYDSVRSLHQGPTLCLPIVNKGRARTWKFGVKGHKRSPAAAPLADHLLSNRQA